MFNSSFANRNLDSSHLLGESCNLLALGLGGIGEIAFILSAEPVLLHIQDWLGWKGTDFFIFFLVACSRSGLCTERALAILASVWSV